MHDQVFNDVTSKKVYSRDSGNPCNPVYKIRDDKGNLIDYGEITGARPKKAYYKSNTEFCDMALKSRDIHGNAPGTASKGNFHRRDRRNQVRNLTQNEDIKGSTPGTLVKGYKLPEGMKNRETHPLDPVY